MLWFHSSHLSQKWMISLLINFFCKWFKNNYHNPNGFIKMLLFCKRRLYLLLYQILAGNHNPKIRDLTMTNNKAIPPIIETISIFTRAGKAIEASGLFLSDQLHQDGRREREKKWAGGKDLVISCTVRCCWRRLLISEPLQQDTQ